MQKINYKYKTNTLLWLVIISILIIFHFQNPLNNDEAVVLEGALNILQGKEIYVNFFEFVSPGVFYLIAFVWQIFGVSYFAAKALAILSMLATLFGVYKISENISTKSINTLGPLIIVLASASWPITMYHNFNLLFMVWAILFLLRGLDLQKNKYFIASGLLTALSILFMQNKGILFMGSLGSFLLILAIKNKIYWQKMFLYGLTSLAPLALLFFKWSPLFLYEKLILFPLQHYLGLPNLSYNLIIIFSLWFLTIVILLIKEKNKKIYLLLYIQIILLINTLALPDFFHISLALFPSYSLLALSLNKISSKTFKQKMVFYTLLASGLMINLIPAMVWPKYYVPFENRQKNNIALDYIKKNCQDSEYIYAGPFLATLYFDNGFKNPTSFSWLITDHHTNEQFLLAREQLITNKPSCAVLDYAGALSFGYNLNNPVDNYIKDNYHQIKNFDRILIYKINDLPTPTTK